MNILACGVVYNEIDILPHLLDYYESQDINVFIFDNFSDDGTWEYLLDHKVDCARLRSDGKFSLVQFIKHMQTIWHLYTPDWCIYLDADEFPLTFQFSSLNEFIADRAFQGFNVIKQTRVNFRPTGTEDFSKGDPFEIYRYYFIKWPTESWNTDCERIFKYSPKIDCLSYAGHKVRFPNRVLSPETLDNPIFHYALRKNAKEKIHRLYLRRNRDKETSKMGWNTHYKKFVQYNKWTWDPKELHDIRDPKDQLYKILNRKGATMQEKK